MDNDPKKQKRLGPAPFASFEKSFEDSSSAVAASAAASASITSTSATIPEDKNETNMEPANGALPKCKPSEVISSIGSKQTTKENKTVTISSGKKLRDIGGKKPAPLPVVNQLQNQMQKLSTLTTPTTPRIELSRASSSSHHEEDSRESSPDNVFEQVGTGTLQEAICLGFREDGALELRTSTEELYFMEPDQKKEEQDKFQQTQKSPVVFKFDEHQSYLQHHQRKDSASSEVAALLCISGRTSRISSVGSQGSAVSRLSAVSAVSRSPSPHRMLLETSFCGPKPLESMIDGSMASNVEFPTAEALEHLILTRKHDPTQAVLAEGIKIENSPKKSQVSNGETKRKTNQSDLKTSKQNPASSRNIKSAPVKKDTKRDPGKVVVGRTASGTDYIRINLKPDHLYPDKGMANHEKLIDAAKLAASHKNKPVSLSIGGASAIEKKTTPSSSPKPSRHIALQKEAGGSRSPSPLNLLSSRKSSICSLFKSRECPESPGEKARSRSKSRDKSTTQSQTGTPNKQKSVLAIFKPKRSGSKSKCSSPTENEPIGRIDGEISQLEMLATPGENRSRPASRLRYYDAPPDGSIYIPLHTPPEEKDTRKLLLKEIEAKLQERRPQSAPIVRTPISVAPTQNETAVVIERAPLKVSKQTAHSAPSKPPPPPPVSKTPKPPQLEKIQKIENLDAIQTLSQDASDVERTWSLEVQRHSSQDSQETVVSDISGSNNSKIIVKTNLPHVSESPSKDICSEIQIKPELSDMPATANCKEKRKILFATKLGSGSQEQIFSTQFSISKTESLTSQLSEHASIPESPAQESGSDHLSRQGTVIRREDSIKIKPPRASRAKVENSIVTESVVTPLSSPAPVATNIKSDSSEEKHASTSKLDSKDDDDPPVVVMMRRKDSEDQKRKSRSASEDDDGSHRHSKYLESFDVRKKLHENVLTKRHSGRHSSDSSIKEQNSRSSSKEEPETQIAPPKTPEKPIRQVTATTLPAAAYDRESVISTDDLGGSSESERDSEMDPNRVRRHLPRHVTTIEDHESTGLVSQDSYDEELPYIPTTLPEERAQGVSIIPMKERVHMELKTCPLDRPRSTTPLNPSSLEEYCGTNAPEVIDNSSQMVRGEKLRISLPRKDITKENILLSKSPRRASSASGKSWFEFAEQGLRGVATASGSGVSKPSEANTTPNQIISNKVTTSETHHRPPLPPRKQSGQWVDFENIPEKRKAPKRITALPKESPKDSKLAMQQYNYVKPEDCQCECHESERESSANKSIASVDLLQQGEDMQPLLDSETHEGIEPSDSSIEGEETIPRNRSCEGIQHGPRSSSRSSGHSQDEELTTTPLRNSVQNSRNRKYYENHQYS